jgi:hypothetical protein
MSYRSTLLATTLCLALASAAAIDPASAHGGGGGGGGFGGGGSFHTSGPSSIAHAPAFAPVHLGTAAGSVSKVLSQPGKFSVPLSSKVTLPSSALTGGMPMEIPGSGGNVIVKQGSHIQAPPLSKVSTLPNVIGTGNKAPAPPVQNGPGPAPLPAPPEAPKHPIGGFGSISVSVLGDAGPIADGDCYRVKRKLSTPEGDVIRYVKVCEVIDADQPE